MPVRPAGLNGARRLAPAARRAVRELPLPLACGTAVRIGGTNGADEGAHLLRVFGAIRLEAAAYVHAPRSHAGDGAAGVLRREAAGEQERQPRCHPRRQRPVEHLAGAADRAGDGGIEQDQRGGADLGGVEHLVWRQLRPHVQRLDHRAADLQRLLPRTRPGKLHKVERYGVGHAVDQRGGLIAEYPDHQRPPLGQRTLEGGGRPREPAAGRQAVARKLPQRAGLRPERLHHAPRLLDRNPAAALLGEDEADQIGAEFGREHGLRGAAQAAELDAGARRTHSGMNSRILDTTSFAVISASPTSTASTPSARTRFASAAPPRPLSLTTTLPGGISGRRRSVTSSVVLKLRRSRLLMPITSAPAFSARSSSASSCTSTRAPSSSSFASVSSSASRPSGRMATISSTASAP